MVADAGLGYCESTTPVTHETGLEEPALLLMERLQCNGMTSRCLLLH